MQNRWNDNTASELGNNHLKLRVYSSRLLGQEPDLVLHGGGNTSVKDEAANLFGEMEELIYVKGSGWDLATIEAEGFAPVRLSVLKRLAELEHLSDADMVAAQRSAMTDPNAPNPSVETILHTIIPFKYVDHTHADAVVAITNTNNGEQRVREIYGGRVLIVPYVMPGFILARRIYEMTRDTDWSQLDGMILLNHGVFTFADTAKQSYDEMIHLVSMAEAYLSQHASSPASSRSRLVVEEGLVELARVRQAVSQTKGSPMIAVTDANPQAVDFSNLSDVTSIAHARSAHTRPCDPHQAGSCRVLGMT